MTGETCQAKIPAATGWRECGEPAIARYRYACMHEHVVDRATCARHAPEPGIVGCRSCFDLGHECEMTFARLRA